MLDYFIEEYLKNKPMFYSLIRPQEALYFYQYKSLIQSPTLDFGCGDGFFAKLILRNKKIDFGLDLKASEIKDSIEKQIYKKIITYPGIKIPFPNNYFQTIISNCVLEHLPYLDKNLKEIYRVLKPKGHFFTTVMTDKWESYFMGTKIFGNSYKDFMKKKQLHCNLYSSEEWKKIFNKTGFKIKKEIGYLSKKNGQILDLSHYLSIGSLINRKLFHRWVIFSRIHSLIKTKKIIKKFISFGIPVNRSAGIFFILRK